MARRSRKAEELKQKIISSVPVEQRKMITQPVTFTFLNGEMSMMQTRIQTMIMEKLQDRIKKALEKRMKEGQMGDLFSSEDYKPISEDDRSMYLSFSVAYSELGVEPTHYNDVDVAARNMQSIVYEKETKDGYRYVVVFPVVDIPKVKEGERRQCIKLHMTEEMAKEIFKVIPYHRYLKDAIFLFSSNYAGRIYLLINANKQWGTWEVEYETLRKILLTTYDKEKKTYVADKYRDINDFKKRVLEPARKEIAEAADRIDCTFDYEFQYPAGKKRGTPEKIIFHIHLTDLGRNINRAQMESQEASAICDRMIKLRLNATDAKKFIRKTPPGMLYVLSEKVADLERIYEDIKKGTYKGEPIKDFVAYAKTSFNNCIDKLNEIQEAEEVRTEEKVTSNNGNGNGNCSRVQEFKGSRINGQEPRAKSQSEEWDVFIEDLRQARTGHIEEGSVAFEDVLSHLQLVSLDDENRVVKLRQSNANLNHSMPWYWEEETFRAIVAKHFNGYSLRM